MIIDTEYYNRCIATLQKHTAVAKYQNKYRIESARAQWWDYGWNGAYFITICTKNSEHFFGKILKTQFIASPLGILAENIWYEIPNQFRYAELGDFVVMPNHFHGILILDKPDGENKNIVNVETRLIASLQNVEQNQNHPNRGVFTGNKNPMINNNISRIIRWFKGRCSFEIRKIQTDFAWQSRFHDHIIRNNVEYQRISDYIINNPANWHEDNFYSL